MKLNVYIYIIIITKLNNLNWFVYIYLNLNDFYLFSKYFPLKHGQVHPIRLELVDEVDDTDDDDEKNKSFKSFKEIIIYANIKKIVNRIAIICICNKQ